MSMMILIRNTPRTKPMRFFRRSSDRTEWHMFPINGCEDEKSGLIGGLLHKEHS